MRALALLLLVLALPAGAQTLTCTKYQRTMTREAQAVLGLSAPVPMFMGQITQESGCRADITASDFGRGLAQFMDGTAKQVAKSYPELGAPNPYSPTWAIRAMVRLDKWNYDRVKGNSDCDRWGAALKGYNAGLGYVQRAQRKALVPGVWFGATEWVNAGQSAKNFEYSRLYPHWIIQKHQPKYKSWGELTCLH